MQIAILFFFFSPLFFVINSQLSHYLTTMRIKTRKGAINTVLGFVEKIASKHFCKEKKTKNAYLILILICAC